MDEWSIATYGSPCRECGFSWSLTVEDAINLVADLPTEYRHTLDRSTGSERHPDLAWSAGAYVCHVADNLHIWTERLQGVVWGTTREVRPYDENRLAEVRGYDAIDLEAALRSLTRACDNWCVAVLEALGREEARESVTLIHPERGEQTLAEVA
jgi:uncharacterized damage-inducible protein DinB